MVALLCRPSRNVCSEKMVLHLVLMQFPLFPRFISPRIQQPMIRTSSPSKRGLASLGLIRSFLSPPASLTAGPGARPIRVLGISRVDGIGAFWQLFEPYVGTVME